jgi:hypothetical protein
MPFCNWFFFSALLFIDLRVRERFELELRSISRVYAPGFYSYFIVCYWVL